jgi:uncharacterized protein
MQTSLPNQDRIAYLDVLRGFTLMGIGLIHMVEQYFAGAPPQAHQNFNALSLGDQIAAGVVGILISGKFFMIFSFLFGLSFYLQLKSGPGGWRSSLRFVWRLILLLIIGFIHHLHYRGDILTIYALLGLTLVVAERLPEKVILIVGLLLMLNIPSVVLRAIDVIQYDPNVAVDPFAGFNGNDKANQTYYDTLKSGSYWAILKANADEHATKMNFQILSGRLYITAGLFLLGLYAGKKKVFDCFWDNQFLFKKGLRFSLWTMLICLVAGAAFFGGFALAKIELPMQHQFLVGGFLMDAFNAAHALLYITALALLFFKPTWQNRVLVFYPVGRMGLTTYLMQTAFGVLIFFGIGLGLLGEIGAMTSVGLSLLFFISQVFFSRWWFTHFQFGVFEWLWRSATRFEIQPLTVQPQQQTRG